MLNCESAPSLPNETCTCEILGCKVPSEYEELLRCARICFEPVWLRSKSAFSLGKLSDPVTTGKTSSECVLASLRGLPTVLVGDFLITPTPKMKTVNSQTTIIDSHFGDWDYLFFLVAFRGWELVCFISRSTKNALYERDRMFSELSRVTREPHG